MPDNVCVCRACVDPRENGYFLQHGLPLLSTYTVRRKGAFVPKPTIEHDVSTTGFMLMQLALKPVFVIQGHRDCAAVKVLFESFEKTPEEYKNTEREFLKSHGEALEAVKRIAPDFSPDVQLTFLEKICVLQSVNNFFLFRDTEMSGCDVAPVVYAYYSISPPMKELAHTDPAQIPLMIFDPAQSVFVKQAEGNKGLRASDLLDVRSFTPYAPDAFIIREPVDLEAVIRNEARFAASNVTPTVEAEPVPALLAEAE